MCAASRKWGRVMGTQDEFFARATVEKTPMSHGVRIALYVGAGIVGCIALFVAIILSFATYAQKEPTPIATATPQTITAEPVESPLVKPTYSANDPRGADQPALTADTTAIAEKTEAVKPPTAPKELLNEFSAQTERRAKWEADKAAADQAEIEAAQERDEAKRVKAIAAARKAKVELELARQLVLRSRIDALLKSGVVKKMDSTTCWLNTWTWITSNRDEKEAFSNLVGSIGCTQILSFQNDAVLCERGAFGGWPIRR